MDEALFTDIVERLERHRQAATYGAIAGVVGGGHRNLMKNQDKSYRNSWVVNGSTRRPTGYLLNDMHPELLIAIEARGVIKTAKQLKEWLKHHEK